MDVMSMNDLMGSIKFEGFNWNAFMTSCDYFYNYRDYVGGKVNSKVAHIIEFEEVCRVAIMKPSDVIEDINELGAMKISREKVYKKCLTLDKDDFRYILASVLDYKKFSHFLDVILTALVYDNFVLQGKVLPC